MTALNSETLDRAAVPHVSALVPLLMTPDARLRPEMRANNWTGSRKALSRSPAINEFSGVWQASDVSGEAGSGRGMTALLCWLLGIDQARAVVILAGLLARIGAIAA